MLWEERDDVGETGCGGFGGVAGRVDGGDAWFGGGEEGVLDLCLDWGVSTWWVWMGRVVGIDAGHGGRNERAGMVDRGVTGQAVEKVDGGLCTGMFTPA